MSALDSIGDQVLIVFGYTQQLAPFSLTLGRLFFHGNFAHGYGFFLRGRSLAKRAKFRKKPKRPNTLAGVDFRVVNIDGSHKEICSSMQESCHVQTRFEIIHSIWKTWVLSEKRWKSLKVAVENGRWTQWYLFQIHFQT